MHRDSRTQQIHSSQLQQVKSKTKTRVIIPNYIYFKSETDFKLFHLETTQRLTALARLWSLMSCPSTCPSGLGLLQYWISILQGPHRVQTSHDHHVLYVHPSGCWSYGLLVRWWYRWLGGELLESGFNLRRTYIKVLPKGQLHWSQLGSLPIWGPDSQLTGHAGDC